MKTKLNLERNGKQNEKTYINIHTNNYASNSI